MDSYYLFISVLILRLLETWTSTRIDGRRSRNDFPCTQVCSQHQMSIPLKKRDGLCSEAVSAGDVALTSE